MQQRYWHIRDESHGGNMFATKSGLMTETLCVICRACKSRPGFIVCSTCANEVVSQSWTLDYQLGS